MPNSTRKRLRRNTASKDVIAGSGATGPAGSDAEELEDAVSGGVNADAETQAEDSGNYRAEQQCSKRTRRGTGRSIPAEAAAPAGDADVVDLCSCDSPEASLQQGPPQRRNSRLQRQQQQQLLAEDGPEPFSHLWQQQQHEPQAHPAAAGATAAAAPSARNAGQPIFYYPAPADLNKSGYTALQFPHHKYDEHFRQTMLDMDRSTDRQWNPQGRVWLVLDQTLDSALQHLQQNGFRPARFTDSSKAEPFEEFCRQGSRRQGIAAAAQQRSTPAAAAGALGLTPRRTQQRSGSGSRRGRHRSRIDEDDEDRVRGIDLDKSEGDEGDEDECDPGGSDDSDDFIDKRTEAEIQREGRERLAAEGRERLLDGQYGDSDADDQDPAVAAASGSGGHDSGSSNGEDEEPGSDLDPAAAAAGVGGSQISTVPLSRDEQREVEMDVRRWEPEALFKWFMRCLLELQLADDAGDDRRYEAIMNSKRPTVIHLMMRLAFKNCGSKLRQWRSQVTQSTWVSAHPALARALVKQSELKVKRGGWKETQRCALCYRCRDSALKKVVFSGEPVLSSCFLADTHPMEGIALPRHGERPKSDARNLNDILGNHQFGGSDSDTGSSTTDTEEASRTPADWRKLKAFECYGSQRARRARRLSYSGKVARDAVDWAFTAQLPPEVAAVPSPQPRRPSGPNGAGASNRAAAAAATEDADLDDPFDEDYTPASTGDAAVAASSEDEAAAAAEAEEQQQQCKKRKRKPQQAPPDDDYEPSDAAGARSSSSIESDNEEQATDDSADGESQEQQQQQLRRSVQHKSKKQRTAQKPKQKQKRSGAGKNSDDGFIVPDSQVEDEESTEDHSDSEEDQSQDKSLSDNGSSSNSEEDDGAPVENARAKAAAAAAGQRDLESPAGGNRRQSRRLAKKQRQSAVPASAQKGLDACRRAAAKRAGRQRGLIQTPAAAAAGKGAGAGLSDVAAAAAAAVVSCSSDSDPEDNQTLGTRLQQQQQQQQRVAAPLRSSRRNAAAAGAAAAAAAAESDLVDADLDLQFSNPAAAAAAGSSHKTRRSRRTIVESDDDGHQQQQHQHQQQAEEEQIDLLDDPSGSDSGDSNAAAGHRGGYRVRGFFVGAGACLARLRAHHLIQHWRTRMSQKIKEKYDGMKAAQGRTGLTDEEILDNCAEEAERDWFKDAFQGLAEIGRLFSIMNTANLHTEHGKRLPKRLKKAEKTILGQKLDG